MTNSRKSLSQTHARRGSPTRLVGPHPDNVIETLPEDDLRRQLDRSRSLMNELTSNQRQDAPPTQPVNPNAGGHVEQTSFQMPVTYAMLPPAGQMLAPTPGALGGNPLQGTPQQGLTPVYQPWPETPGYYVVSPTPQMLAIPQIPAVEQQAPRPS